MIYKRIKGFSIVEFLVASTLTLAVVGSSTIAITIAQKQQQKSFYNDISYSIGNSIIQQSRAIGCGMANGDPAFDNKIFNACKARFVPGSEVEINTQFPIKNTSVTNLINIPATDGNNYVYSISETVKLKIIYRTAWLSSGTLATYGSNSANTSACSFSDSQPNIFRRELNIFTVKDGLIVNARNITDYQSINKQSGNFNSSTSGSVQITETSKVKEYYKLEGGASGQVIYRLPDQKNCAWFGFLPAGKEFKFSSNTDSQGKKIIIVGDKNEEMVSLT